MKKIYYESSTNKGGILFCVVTRFSTYYVEAKDIISAINKVITAEKIYDEPTVIKSASQVATEILK